MELENMTNENVNVEENEVTEVTEKVTNENVNSEAQEDNSEPAVAIKDTDNPLDEVSVEQIGKLLKQVEEMVRMMEDQWNMSKNEFELTDTHMKQLYQYNEEHRTEMPEGLSEEEQQKWDRFNGLDNIPEEKVLEIFGEGHPIIGVENTVTIDRIKDCINDFFGWMSAMKEYRQIHDAYLELVELEEEKNIEKLKVIAENESDPDKKSKMMESVNMYYSRKYLGFLSDELNKSDRDRIINAYSSNEKITYWLKRTRDKLHQIKISDKFILEISQFEKRYLEEKYHKCSNILLVYFMNLIVYSDMHDKNNEGRNKAICMVISLDAIISNRWKNETRENVLNNVRALLDQVIDLIPESNTNKE